MARSPNPQVFAVVSKKTIEGPTHGKKTQHGSYYTTYHLHPGNERMALHSTPEMMGLAEVRKLLEKFPDDAEACVLKPATNADLGICTTAKVAT